MSEKQQRLVLSNKKAVADVEGTLDINSLSVGDVIVGSIQTVKPYGAFIDMNGVTGLLHVSQVRKEKKR